MWVRVAAFMMFLDPFCLFPACLPGVTRSASHAGGHGGTQMGTPGVLCPCPFPSSERPQLEVLLFGGFLGKPNF